MSNPNFIIRKECPACASESLRKIYQNPFNDPPIKNYLEEFYSIQGGVEFEFLEGALYVLCACDTCGLIFQRDILNDIFMERLYEIWIDHQKVYFNDKNHELEYYSGYAQEIMRIIAYFQQVPSSLCLFDFGMGWGKWALMAKAFGCESYGSELSEARMQAAKSNGVKIVLWDEIPQHQFNFINTEQVFEHLSYPFETLSHLSKALRPNGLLKISVPTANDIVRRLRIMDWKSPKGSRNSLNPVAPLEHINCFSRSSLIAMASRAGMEEVSMPMRIQYRFTTDWSGISKIVKNLLLPIHRNMIKRRNYILLRNKNLKGDC